MLTQLVQKEENETEWRWGIIYKPKQGKVEVGDVAKISQFLIHSTLYLGLIAQNSVILTAPRFE